MAGPYLPQYDVYFKKLDVDGKGEIGAMEAATFLKKSGLSDEMLGKVRKNMNHIILSLEQSYLWTLNILNEN